MFKKFLSLATVFCLFAGVAFAGGNQESGSGGAKASGKGDSFKIGVIYPLSGDKALLGGQCLLGA